MQQLAGKDLELFLGCKALLHFTASFVAFFHTSLQLWLHLGFLQLRQVSCLLQQHACKYDDRWPTPSFAPFRLCVSSVQRRPARKPAAGPKIQCCCEPGLRRHCSFLVSRWKWTQNNSSSEEGGVGVGPSEKQQAVRGPRCRSYRRKPGRDRGRFLRVGPERNSYFSIGVIGRYSCGWVVNYY